MNLSVSIRSALSVAVLGCLALAISPFAQGQATDFGSLTLGGVATPVAVPVTLQTSATLGSVSVVTQGISGLDFKPGVVGTCVVGTSYASGASCTVNVKFKPLIPGMRYGAVVLLDGAGNVIGTSFLQGKGIGRMTAFLPGTESTVSASVDGPGTVSLDGNGNVYIADCDNNRVVKETLSAGTYTESVVPTGTLKVPYAVAVDGAGNLFIVDSENNRVLKETLSAGNYAESVVPGSALNYPTDVAVDANGKVYIADLYNHRVLVETMTSGGNVETVLPFSNLNQPSAVAVDTNGIVYIADSGNNQVLVATPASGSYTISTLATSALNYPGAVRVDGGGNIYIADTFNQRVLKETSQGGGIYTESVMATSALSFPYGLAIDGNSNLYISDTFHDRVIKEDFSIPPSLGYASTTVFATSVDSPQAVTVTNAGNSTLTFTGLSFPADFPEGSSAKECTATKTLASNASCKLTINFTPVTQLNGVTSAPLSESVILTTNTLNNPGTAQSIITSGTETLTSQSTQLVNKKSRTR
jgi:sugar lactone lactonase YvrE